MLGIALFEPELDRAVVVVVGVLVEQQRRALVAVALVVGRLVEGQARVVRRSACRRRRVRPERARLDLVASPASRLEQLDDELAGGDLVGLGQHLDVDRPGVALALLVDREHRDDDLLEGRAAVDEP